MSADAPAVPELPWPYYLQLLDLLAREGRLQRDDVLAAVQPALEARLRAELGDRDAEARTAVIEMRAARLAEDLLDAERRHGRFRLEAVRLAAGATAYHVLRELCHDDVLRTSAVGQLVLGVGEGTLSKPAAAALLRRLKADGWSLDREPIIRWLHLQPDLGGEPS